MFSIEIKVDGQPVATVVGSRLRPTADGHFEYTYHGSLLPRDQRKKPKVFKGSVEWRRGASILGLATLVIEDAFDNI